MKVSNQKIENLIYIIFVALIPFQDTAMKDTFLGFLGYYLSIIPLSILTLYHFFTIKKIECSKKMIYVTVWFLLISIIMIPFYIDKGYIDLMLYKTITNFIVYIIYCLTIYFTYKVDNQTLKIGIGLAFIIHLLSIIISDYIGYNDGIIIHSSYYDIYGRLRGFCSESSWFAYTLIILGMIFYSLLKYRILKILVVSLTVSIVLISGSKGSIVCLAILGIYSIYSYFNNKILKIVGGILAGVTLICIYPYLIALFNTDIEYYTSFSTRFSSILASFLILLHNPLGTGFGAFTFAYRDSILEGFHILEWLTGLRLNMGEIEMYTQADLYQSGATIKSIILQWMAFFGLPFIYLFVQNIKEYFEWVVNNRQVTLKYIFLMVILAGFTYAPFMFESCVCLGYLLKEKNKPKL